MQKLVSEIKNASNVLKEKSIEELENVWPDFINSLEPSYLNLTRKIREFYVE
jgi:hypothetical protein